MINIHTLEIKTQPKECPLPCEDCTVILEAPETATLLQLAEAILESVGFENDHLFGFYDDLKFPYSSETRYTLSADYGEENDPSVPGVSKVTVGGIFPKGQKLIFLFDYGDDWKFLVTCLGVETAAANRKAIRETSITGTPPTQYPDFE